MVWSVGEDLGFWSGRLLVVGGEGVAVQGLKSLLEQGGFAVVMPRAGCDGVDRRRGVFVRRVRED